MRITIDTADTPIGSAPIEIHAPEQAIAVPTGTVRMAGALTGELAPRYDGGADMASPLTERTTAISIPGPAAPIPAEPAHDGGASPSTAAALGQGLPTQIEAQAHLGGESAAG
jgi:hypothetical protein